MRLGGGRLPETLTLNASSGQKLASSPVAPSYRKTRRKRWGAKPPTLSNGFCGGRVLFRAQDERAPARILHNLKYHLCLVFVHIRPLSGKTWRKDPSDWTRSKHAAEFTDKQPRRPYLMFRNSASGPESWLSGRISTGIGKASKSALRPAGSPLKARFWSFPIRIRGSPISGPIPNREAWKREPSRNPDPES